MSQEYFSPKGKSPLAQEIDGDRDTDGDTEHPGKSPAGSSTIVDRPAYMTVGTGSTSQHAARLQTMLDPDSGYGGSIAGDGVSSSASNPRASAAWDSAVQEDRPMPVQRSHPPTDAHRRAQAGTVHQLWYNQHRVTLGRSISQVVELLKGLQHMNARWPAHYPSIQRAETNGLTRSSSRPNFQHASSISDNFGPSSSSTPPPFLKRSMTSLEDRAEAESSKAAENRPAPEPRLVTPQIAQEFSVLKLDLKLGSLHQTELVHSLEKGSIASLLDGRISSSIKHLLSLRDRIEDTSSKVLITGDLNAGKSTFCNALLRRKVLPEDQQPCTSIFCEVLDARENSGIEEVHAIHKDAVYDRHDEATYDVFTLPELEKIVTDNATYMQCKVYLCDVRTIDESLLNNGVVDIALIDAPGLNMDTTKTTAIFARQEEIDVVVFVVSAANHFTMTAREFIWAAAAEKAYLFIVVNGFDTIKDKDRCQKMILEQVDGLSPRTFKESSELVHFVSSNAVPTAPFPPGGPGGGGSSSGGGGGDDPSDDDASGKGKDKEKMRDFSNLEQSLRRFVLEKRARSKLAPAKTYLLNILNDINTLASVNAEVAESELHRVTKELQEIEPLLESSQKAKAEISDQIDKTIEDTCKNIYDSTRRTLNSAIEHAGDNALGVPYPGLFNAMQYAEDLKEAMLSQIAASVTHCEEQARTETVSGVNAIKQLGILHLGDEYTDLNFRPDVMFRRRRDALARQVDIPTELWDFVDWPTLIQRQEKVAGTGMALTVATAVGTQLIGGYGWMDHALSAARIVGDNNLRRMIIPGIVVAGKFEKINSLPLHTPHLPYLSLRPDSADTPTPHSNGSRLLRPQPNPAVPPTAPKRQDLLPARHHRLRARQLDPDRRLRAQGPPLPGRLPPGRPPALRRAAR